MTNPRKRNAAYMLENSIQNQNVKFSGHMSQLLVAMAEGSGMKQQRREESISEALLKLIKK